MPKKLILALLLLLFILSVRFFLFFSQIESFQEGQRVAFETQVSDEPKLSVRSIRFSAVTPDGRKIFINAPLDLKLKYGDKVRVEGQIKIRTLGKRAIYVLDYPEIEKTGKSSLEPIYFVREKIISFFNSALGPVYSGLMLGIVFGIKESLPDAFYDKLQAIGLLHVIAASGMNITLLGGILANLFGFFLRRQIALILTILGILFYAVLAGLEPSIVRASVMGILVFSAQILGRQNFAILGLSTAGFIMLFLNPVLISDIGFQLSFVATLGLITFRPILDSSKRVKIMLKKSLIGEDLATTFTAQIFTLPILLLNFGSYSPLSLLANALILWTIPPLMILGGLAAVAGLMLEPLGRLVLYLSLPLLLFFEKTVDLFASIGSQFKLDRVPEIAVFGYYLLLLALVLFKRGKT